MECAMFGIPVIAPLLYPYAELITDKQNGIILKKKEDLSKAVDFLYQQGQRIGLNAHQFVKQYLGFQTTIPTNPYLQIVNVRQQQPA